MYHYPTKMGPPQQGVFKLNTDGSFNSQNIGGIGGVFRNHRGEWIKRHSRYLINTSPIQAELVALLEGLKLAKSHSLWPLLVEIDVLEVIKYSTLILTYTTTLLMNAGF